MHEYMIWQHIENYKRAYIEYYYFCKTIRIYRCKYIYIQPYFLLLKMCVYMCVCEHTHGHTHIHKYTHTKKGLEGSTAMNSQ